MQCYMCLSLVVFVVCMAVCSHLCVCVCVCERDVKEWVYGWARCHFH